MSLLKYCYYFSLVAGLAIVSISCDSKGPTSSPAKTEITSNNVIGKWYSAFTDESAGLSMILYLDNGPDSASVGMLNGTEEVEILRFEYYVNGGTFTFVAPAVDTASQNALQIYFASSMEGFLYSDEVYMQSGNICFVEDPDIYTFSPAIPAIPGGRISGILSVNNGTFGQGMAMISAIDPNTEAIQMIFTDKPGTFSIPGLKNGSYWLMGVYIPKEHAADFTSHDLSEFPMQLQQTPLAISGGNTIAGESITIDLALAKELGKANIAAISNKSELAAMLRKACSAIVKR